MRFKLKTRKWYWDTYQISLLSTLTVCKCNKGKENIVKGKYRRYPVQASHKACPFFRSALPSPFWTFESSQGPWSVSHSPFQHIRHVWFRQFWLNWGWVGWLKGWKAEWQSVWRGSRDNLVPSLVGNGNRCRVSFQNFDGDNVIVL